MPTLPHLTKTVLYHLLDRIIPMLPFYHTWSIDYQKWYGVLETRSPPTTHTMWNILQDGAATLQATEKEGSSSPYQQWAEIIKSTIVSPTHSELSRLLLEEMSHIFQAWKYDRGIWMEPRCSPPSPYPRPKREIKNG